MTCMACFRWLIQIRIQTADDGYCEGRTRNFRGIHNPVIKIGYKQPVINNYYLTNNYTANDFLKGRLQGEVAF